MKLRNTSDDLEFKIVMPVNAKRLNHCMKTLHKHIKTTTKMAEKG